ncbi:N-acetylmannosamine-6-phosphate 2-epimerase [Paenibacillus sp. UNC451MF]|uniref:N-acetylmannosamine-6-phosphate 2-epimerase n=1 Tax=Paenibacillus sp. UNC451MF TaxID=1449063 RepID=UPI00048DA2E0|nr:N-acetylmannosamine-6-phosphate 2-epimerase [Paenibacillus sp. UNC451MF]
MKSIIPLKGLVVSCQALEDEPLHGSSYMVAMAKAAHMGGAVGIRSNGAQDIRAIKQALDLPVIGLNKKLVQGYDVYITPTVEDAVEVHRAGADIVAMDGTGRARPDGRTLEETIRELHAQGILVMADISTLEEGVYAASLGADYISTTLSGYTPYSRQEPGPDLPLITQLKQRVSVPVAAEGRIGSPQEAAAAIDAGADFVVVGGAITRPQCITASFVNEIKSSR